MTLDLATVVGLIGSAMMVVAFAYSNLTRAMNLVFFNLLNLVGSVLLGGSLLVHVNIASLALEIVWGAVALFGLIKAVLTRAPA